MSSVILKEARSLAREAATRATWLQWGSLGAGALTSENATAQSIIDPEALVLGSLAMLAEERRLGDMLSWWARVGSRLLSVQRMKALAAAYPDSTRIRLRQFARSAAEAKDGRWVQYAAEEPIHARDRAGKEAKVPNLASGPALWLRLRAGFGVGAKPDTLAYIMGTEERAATVQQIRNATGYTGVTVRSATRDLLLARMIRQTDEHPVRYYAQRDQQRGLLALSGAVGNSDIPVWRHWTTVFAFLAHVNDLERIARAESDNEFVQGYRARDVFLKHQRAFTDNSIDVPNQRDHPGPTFLVAFRDAVRAMKDFMEQNL